MQKTERVTVDGSKLFKLCDEFDNHRKEYVNRIELEDKRFENLLKSQENNIKAIEQLTEDVKKTYDIIELYRDLKGMARIWRGSQAFLLSCFKLGAVFSVVIVAYDQTSNYLKDIIFRIFG